MSEAPNDNRASVPANDMWWFLLTSVRYSMGRLSYAVSLTADLVRSYRRFLTPAQVEQIAREIREHLAREDGYTAGFRDIPRTWRELADWLSPPRASETEGEE